MGLAVPVVQRLVVGALDPPAPLAEPQVPMTVEPDDPVPEDPEPDDPEPEDPEPEDPEPEDPEPDDPEPVDPEPDDPEPDDPEPPPGGRAGGSTGSLAAR